MSVKQAKPMISSSLHVCACACVYSRTQASLSLRPQSVCCVFPVAIFKKKKIHRQRGRLLLPVRAITLRRDEREKRASQSASLVSYRCERKREATRGGSSVAAGRRCEVSREVIPRGARASSASRLGNWRRPRVKEGSC